ncbi:YafY family protein [Psychrosphaera haliotis]|uniref:WYL domain-containing protein n=2 Tax=Psychrosphaera haliotis TaxID=555083 RepID=UPI0031D660B5
MKDTKDLTLNQKQIFAFIDFSLFFKGHLGLKETIDKFGLDHKNAVQYFERYKSFLGGQCEFDEKALRYFQLENFKPVFNHDPRKTLVKLAHQISDGFDAITQTEFPVEQPSYLNAPDIEVIARLMRAILNGNVVNIIYTSLSNGSAGRDIVPHAIVDNGLRWHVRGFDKKTNSFRDFVLTRISKVTIKSNDIATYENRLADVQWQRVLDLVIVPHPKNVEFSTAVEMDYGMTDGKMTLKVRAAMAGYLLRRWNVDCTPQASLNSPEYQLHLANIDSLTNLPELSIAPGYIY